MYTSPPQSVLSSAPLTFTNPSQPQSSTPAVNAQIANASSWIVQVQTQYGSVSVQPFTASTLPILEQTVTVTPTLQLGTVISGLSGGTVSISWMIANEPPPIPDGPLTAAAIQAAQQISSVSSAILFTTTIPSNLGFINLTTNLDVSQYQAILLEVANNSTAHIIFTLVWLTPGLSPAFTESDVFYSTINLNMSQVVWSKGQQLNLKASNSIGNSQGAQVNIIGLRQVPPALSFPSGTGFFEHIWNVSALAIAAGTNSSPILPNQDYSGPAYFSGIVDLTVAGANAAFIDVLDFDQNDNQVNSASITRFTGPQWPGPTNGHLYINPTPFYLSRYRHKLVVSNAINTGSAATAYVEVVPAV